MRSVSDLRVRHGLNDRSFMIGRLTTTDHGPRTKYQILNMNDKRDFKKIMDATTFIMEVAEELDYEYQDMLRQCLDELDTLAMNELEA